MGERRLPGVPEFFGTLKFMRFVYGIWSNLLDYFYFRETHEIRRKNIRTNNADPASPATRPNTASDTVTGICFSIQTDTSRRS